MVNFKSVKDTMDFPKIVFWTTVSLTMPALLFWSIFKGFVGNEKSANKSVCQMIFFPARGGMEPILAK